MKKMVLVMTLSIAMMQNSIHSSLARSTFNYLAAGISRLVSKSPTCQLQELLEQLATLEDESERIVTQKAETVELIALSNIAPHANPESLNPVDIETKFGITCKDPVSSEQTYEEDALEVIFKENAADKAFNALCPDIITQGITLIKAGADAQTTDSKGNTLLHRAFQQSMRSKDCLGNIVYLWTEHPNLRALKNSSDEYAIDLATKELRTTIVYQRMLTQHKKKLY